MTGFPTPSPSSNAALQLAARGVAHTLVTRVLLADRPSRRPDDLVVSGSRWSKVALPLTWIDDLPDEARAITTLSLADAAAAGLMLADGTAWAALIDESAASGSERALAAMRRARFAGRGP